MSTIAATFVLAYHLLRTRGCLPVAFPLHGSSHHICSWRGKILMLMRFEHMRIDAREIEAQVRGKASLLTIICLYQEEYVAIGTTRGTSNDCGAIL